MDPATVAMVTSALRSTDLELTCPGKLECVDLATDLTRFLAMAAGGWSPDQKAEWHAAALSELRDLPFLLVSPSLKEARRRVSYPGKLLPWIMEDIDVMYGKMKTERAMYQRLLEIAG